MVAQKLLERLTGVEGLTVTLMTEVALGDEGLRQAEWEAVHRGTGQPRNFPLGTLCPQETPSASSCFVLPTPGPPPATQLQDGTSAAAAASCPGRTLWSS